MQCIVENEASLKAFHKGLEQILSILSLNIAFFSACLPPTKMQIFSILSEIRKTRGLSGSWSPDN